MEWNGVGQMLLFVAPPGLVYLFLFAAVVSSSGFVKIHILARDCRYVRSPLLRTFDFF